MTMNKEINDTIVNSIKRKSLLYRIFKYLLVILASVTLLILAFVAWIYFTLIAGPGPFEFNDFHPFKSSKAKLEYLAYEDAMVKNWPVISEEKTVTTSFGKTFMRISGPVDAPPLVLLPGGGSNSLIWDANIEAFSEKYRTYALDNIYDWGRSVYVRKIENGQDFANWLDELFDTLQLGNSINLAGYSYGGWVASQYALNFPARLAGLVLIAPAWTILDVTMEFLFAMAKSILPIRTFKSDMMYWVWKDLAEMGETGKRRVEDRIDYYQIAMKCFKFKTGVQPTVLTDTELNQLKMPVLYLVGENETIYDGESAINRLRETAPQIETFFIRNTGHDLMFTHTDMVNRRILEFLKK
ncbi:carboxylesterase [Chitinispirillum alkaliphilum]|nr:carboxylesterase [Chitinispirillum alkaliphilum]